MLKKLLSQSSYWIINKDLTIQLGIETSMLLTHLIDCADAFNQPFYQQKERIMDSIGISERQWRKSMKILQDKGILQVIKKGNPAKNYYTIIEKILLDVLQSASTSEAQMSVSSQAQMSATKKVINKVKTTTSEDKGGGTPQEFPTTNLSLTHDEGGWEKLIRLYPKDKMNDELSAISKWNTLTQEDKQKVFRHLKVYIKNTEHQFIKQIGNYFREEPWTKMKPKRKKNEGLEIIDGTQKSQQSLENDDFLRNLAIIN